MFLADSCHWTSWHTRRISTTSKRNARVRELSPFRTVTTDEVLAESSTCFQNGYLRKAAVEMVQAIYRDANIRVLPQTRNSFLSGLRLYRERLDKTYSLTDCISMQTMRDEGIDEVFTEDKHFEQEGFNALYRSCLR